MKRPKPLNGKYKALTAKARAEPERERAVVAPVKAIVEAVEKPDAFEATNKPADDKRKETLWQKLTA
jgi:hypothetical protein